MQTFINDVLEVLRIGFWATFWSLLGSCIIALAFAWGEQWAQRISGGKRSVYTGPRARNGTILVLSAIVALASSWGAWAVIGGGPRADSLGEQILKAVTGTDLGHIALLVASVVSVLVFSWGAILYLYAEGVEDTRADSAMVPSAPPKAA